jgi:peptide/nickel transport system ATP-binding protein
MMTEPTRSQPNSSEGSLVSIRNLTVDFRIGRGYFRAVDGVSFDIMPGEILGLAGESGSGKSTIASAMLRLIESISRVDGEIMWGKSNLLRLNDRQVREYRWKLISMVFQGAMNSLDPVFTISSQIVETIRSHNINITNEDAKTAALDLLKKVGIDPLRAEDYPHQLSGGMRQRVMIAMALALKPKLLIADEPTSALDVVTQRQIVELLRQLQAEYNLSVLFITHDLPLLSGICDRMAVMHRGRIVEIGSHDEILGNPKHPYTELLVSSVPSLSKKSLSDVKFVDDEHGKEGLGGCKFYARCPISIESCKSIDPKLRPVRGTKSQRVACIMHDGWSEY